MPRKRWSELSPKAKVTIVAVAAIDAGLRAWALRDLAGRDAAHVNGPKWLWGGALGLLSSSGIAPAAYLLVGRKS
ncbi:hypothetical protein [Mycobacterium sp. ACS4331]|uniref:hypothetical protein n=1 Tax=Mycobacterium sp. ACS4331 TaxID=1834121 RepID=UPI00080074F1|nr:hypothetical protein [Mycobacterium sp. ACS4331]OBF18456.1 hypothetical protein A5727_10935 [Mycobacterium sp. ACS4331]